MKQILQIEIQSCLYLNKKKKEKKKRKRDSIGVIMTWVSPLQ